MTAFLRQAHRRQKKQRIQNMLSITGEHYYRPWWWRQITHGWQVSRMWRQFSAPHVWAVEWWPIGVSSWRTISGKSIRSARITNQLSPKRKGKSTHLSPKVRCTLWQNNFIHESMCYWNNTHRDTDTHQKCPSFQEFCFTETKADYNFSVASLIPFQFNIMGLNTITAMLSMEQLPVIRRWPPSLHPTISTTTTCSTVATTTSSSLPFCCHVTF